MKNSTDHSPVEKGSAAASSSARRPRAPGRLARKAYEQGYRAALQYQADLLDGALGDVIEGSIVAAYLDGRADAGDDPVTRRRGAARERRGLPTSCRDEASAYRLRPPMVGVERRLRDPACGSARRAETRSEAAGNRHLDRRSVNALGSSRRVWPSQPRALRRSARTVAEGACGTQLPHTRRPYKQPSGGQLSLARVISSSAALSWAWGSGEVAYAAKEAGAFGESEPAAGTDSFSSLRPRRARAGAGSVQVNRRSGDIPPPAFVAAPCPVPSKTRALSETCAVSVGEAEAPT
jgi:hypothetical protein